MADIRDKMMNRLVVISTLLGLLPLIIVIQVLRINWVNGSELRELGAKQAASVDTTQALRGAILDRRGRTLAYSDARYHLAIDPQVKGFAEKRKVFFDALADLTGKDASNFWVRLRQNPSSRYVLLTGSSTNIPALDENQKKQVESWQIPGVLFEDRISRRYSYGSLAGAVLGYLTKGNGYIGIEQYYDSILHGIDGHRPFQRDRQGNIQLVSTSKIVEPKDGESLVLTLDLQWQSIIEEELAKKVEAVGATFGSAIAVNPKTGEVLAMVNVPSYNPNNPIESPAEYQKNQALTHLYEPGSTFKLMTMATAIDQGIAKMSDFVSGEGGYWKYRQVESADDHPKAMFSLSEAVAYSSNIVMAKLALKFKRDVFYQYLRNFGFGQRTFIDLPNELPGDLRNIRDNWGIATQVTASRGYGITVTPMQMVMAYAAFANNGVLMQPYVVSERISNTGETRWKTVPKVVRRVLKPQTVKDLMPAFEKVVEDKQGTGHAAYIQGLRIAGKTGTAQIPINGVYSKQFYHASFVGMFPANDPQVVISIVLYRPQANFYGGETAAPVFGNIAARLVGSLPEVSRQLSRKKPVIRSQEAVIPNVKGLPLATTLARLNALGFQVEMPNGANDWSIVTSIEPKEGLKINTQTVLTLTTEETKPSQQQEMPNLVGWDIRYALNWLTARGVRVKADGSGIVLRQFPEAGQGLRQNAVLYGNK